MEVVLNAAQRAAVSWYFDEANTEGEEWPLNEPVQIDVRGGQLIINGAYLHSDANWSTYGEPAEVLDRTY